MHEVRRVVFGWEESMSGEFEKLLRNTKVNGFPPVFEVKPPPWWRDLLIAIAAAVVGGLIVSEREMIWQCLSGTCYAAYALALQSWHWMSGLT
jgi:hypothetical protein